MANPPVGATAAERMKRRGWTVRIEPILFYQNVTVEFCQRMAAEGYDMVLIKVTENSYGFIRTAETGGAQRES